MGGETAEMPGFYANYKYDLAGFCVGLVEEDKLINGQKILENDLIIAIESNGIHSNGFSLVRKIIDDNPEIEKRFYDQTKLQFYDELLKPTQIYFNLINHILNEDIEIKGINNQRLKSLILEQYPNIPIFNSNNFPEIKNNCCCSIFRFLKINFLISFKKHFYYYY